MPMEVSMTIATIDHIHDGSIGMKKNRIEVKMQMRDAPMNAPLLEPTIVVNFGERPPKIIQVTSPNAIRTVELMMSQPTVTYPSKQ